nr:hypothetical protein [Paenarthrobacter ilicis]
MCSKRVGLRVLAGRLGFVMAAAKPLKIGQVVRSAVSVAHLVVTVGARIWAALAAGDLFTAPSRSALGG